MAKIVTLKSPSDEDIYPVTDASGIRVTGNVTLQQALDGFVYADDPTTSANPDGWITPSEIDWSTFTDSSTYFTIGNLLIQFGLKDFGNVSYNYVYWGSTNRSQNYMHIDFPKAFSGNPYYVSINPIGTQQMAAVWNTNTNEDSATKSRDFNILVPSSQTGTLSTKVYWLAIGPA